MQTFVDVGLASWLLGLRYADQVARAPLWGSLFENFVVMEALKDRFNRGDPAPLHFYRDATGHEVDLLIGTGSRWRAVETNAGATVGSDWFRGLAQFRKDHADHLEAGCVVYGGETSQARSDWPVWSWKALLQGPPG